MSSLKLAENNSYNINPIKLSRCIVKLEEIYGIKHGNNQFWRGNNFPSKTQEELANDLGMTQQNLIKYKSLQKLTPIVYITQDKKYQCFARSGYCLYSLNSRHSNIT